MKFILILQSAIIFLGAAYWFLFLRTASVPPTVPDVIVTPIATTTNSTIPPISPEPAEEFYQGTTSIRYDDTGPTDAGMEFPIPDAELQL
jgi:hypothetical protein